MKLKVFHWHGIAPREVWVRVHHQAPCVGAFPSAAAFLRAVDTTRAFLPYVSVIELREGESPGNEGSALALAHPGIIYWKDEIRHAPRDAPWLVHPQPDRSA